MGAQCSYFLGSRPMDFVCNGSINVRWNEQNIITHKALGPIPHKIVIPCDVVMFHEQSKVQKPLLKV
jgi:hypothetical protein